MRPRTVKALRIVFWSLVVANAVIFALIWLERGLAMMDGDLRSQQVAFFERESSACLMLGPLHSHGAAKELADRVRRDGGRTIIRNGEILSRPDYVVHVEPSASRDLAVRTLRELKEQAINGHVISDGKLANAVSVGVFGLLAPAEVRRQTVADFGYDVEIARFERRRTAYWVYADEASFEKPNGVPLTPCPEP